MGFKCIKLQKPPRVHSLKQNSRGTVRTPRYLLRPLTPLILNALSYKHHLLPRSRRKSPKDGRSEEVHCRSSTPQVPAVVLFLHSATPKPQASRIPAAPALPHLVLTAAGLSEVSHRGELGMDGLPVEPAIVQVNHSLLCILFTAELKAKSAFSEKQQEIKDSCQSRCVVFEAQ